MNAPAAFDNPWAMECDHKHLHKCKANLIVMGFEAVYGVPAPCCDTWVGQEDGEKRERGCIAYVYTMWQ
jgi:hypothetical protein